MITQKSDKEIELLREGGRRLGRVLGALSREVRPGRNIADLDRLAYTMITEAGDAPAFLNYRPQGADRPYPASVCISINDEIVHGIPTEGEKVLREGDIVTLDTGIIHEGLVTDSAVTVGVGAISEEATLLLTATERGLYAAIDVVRAGIHVGDIGAAIEEVAKSSHLAIYRELVGHGVGYSVHEDPYIPNFGKKGAGSILKAGTVIAIEPMFGLGTEEIILEADGYTYSSADGSLSAHFEHTIVVTEDGAEILTSRS